MNEKAQALGLSGTLSSSAQSDEFAATSERAVAELAPTFTLDNQFEYVGKTGCVTHRYAVFTRGEENIAVSAWRVGSVADPFWVPNEAPFRPLDDATLVSEGEHITVVLVVAPDGTTSRVSGYGARANLMVVGWPTTFPRAEGDPPPGSTPVPTDVLIGLAHRMLDAVLVARDAR